MFAPRGTGRSSQGTGARARTRRVPAHRAGLDNNLALRPGLVHHIPNPNPYRRPPGMSLEAFCDEKGTDLGNAILEIGPENVACFMAEPIMGAVGVIVPPPGYHQRTREICEITKLPLVSHRRRAFLKRMMAVGVTLTIANTIHYATSNKSARQNVSPADLENPGVYLLADIIAKCQSLIDVGDALRLCDEAWTAIQAS